jgi:hypothetical protein
MRDFRDAKAMARALRDALKARAVEITHAEALELIAKAFGYENWNILSAKIEAAEPPAGDLRSLPTTAENKPAPPKALHRCSFCNKNEHDVRKLIAGPPPSFICDECVNICTNVVEPDHDTELFRLMKGKEESGGEAHPALLELARGMPTEELAHYVERGRRGIERIRIDLQVFERRLALRDPGSAEHNALAAQQQKAQRELKRYEDARNIATTVLGERRQ